MTRLRLSTLLLCACAIGLSARHEAAPSAGDGVALKAGTIHLVEEGVVLERGGTILVRDGRIVAVGEELEIPVGTRVVDYGPGAVIVPGLVSAYSSYSFGAQEGAQASPRTADLGTRAIDGFDFYARHASALVGGVTSVYAAPPEGRLIAGQGAMLKLAGDELDERILNGAAALHGAIDQSARNTPGFWEPPIPATVDVGLGYREPQLPRSTMGAIVALEELVALAASGQSGDETYGPRIGADLARVMQARVPWRIAASEPAEIRALLAFARERQIPLILDKAEGAKELADEIAELGAAVVYRPPYNPNSPARDLGKGRDVSWPSYDVPAALQRAGVRFAIAGTRPHDLLFAAGLASRGGLDPVAALRAITLTPAEMFGASDRIGSIRAGKDADFTVLSAAPLSGQASVLATWIGGKLVWDPASSGPREQAADRPLASVLIEVEELYLGDGRVLRPGQIAVENGKIVDVGASVARPRGARVASGKAAMPGMIDALGHLGLEGSKKVPGTDYRLSAIVAPGDRVDRKVAAAGITTVVLSPRGPSKSGAPIMAYKPAATDLDQQVLGDPVALRLAWTNRNRLESGDSVRELLDKAKGYMDKWAEYEKAMSEWTPPPVKPESEEEADEDEDEKDEAEDGDEDDDKKKKGKKKDDEDELEPDPITGVWQAEIARPPRAETSSLKMRLHLEPEKGSGDVEGNLRSEPLSEELIELSGYWDREAATLSLRGLGTRGWVSISAKIEEQKLVGTIEVGGSELDLEAERISKEWVVAGRSERLAEEVERPKPPKGTPKKPKRDAKLEPLVAAMQGRASIVVQVDREDEILDCVDAFADFGIKPVLYGASDAHLVKDRLVGRVAGILPSAQILVYEPELGTDWRTPYLELQSAGIPVAFHSDAEEGAAELPLIAAYAVANGMSASGALRALTADAAKMMSISEKVGLIAPGYDADVLLLDGPPLAPGTSVLRTWVNGVEVEVE